MNVRRAAEPDLPAIEELWRAFEREIPPPPYEEVDADEELREIREIVRSGVAFVAEEDGAVLGFALARRRGPRVARLTDLYVVPEARGRAIARELVHQVVEGLRGQGFDALDLEVMAQNAPARAVYARWGFSDVQLTLSAPLEALAERLGREERPSFGSIHVQTDDAAAVERAVRQFVPRLPGRSRGSVVAPPRNGWIAVYDDVCDRDPAMLRRLAHEISERMGAVVLTLGVEQQQVVRYLLFDGGRLVDEYLSVPEYYGPLPPGDAMAMGANPTVVSRLAGTDREALRSVARTAASPAELPPPHELLASLASVLAIEGAQHGWADAPEISGATRIDR